MTRQIIDAVGPYLKRPSRSSPPVQSDFDRERDIARDLHVIFVAGKPRQLTPAFWQLFTLLYCRRGTVIPSEALRSQRENLRRLRKLLTGSRYQIVNYRDIGYQLIVPSDPEAANPKLL